MSTTKFLIVLNCALFLASSAPAQSAKDLVGSYTLMSAENVRSDGTNTPIFGGSPRGYLVLDGTGRYILAITRGGIPKFAGNNRETGTIEENRSVVQSTIAHFGRYTVDESAKAITFHIENSTFPNWEGTEQKRIFTLTGDELRYTVPVASTGAGSAELQWKRSK